MAMRLRRLGLAACAALVSCGGGSSDSSSSDSDEVDVRVPVPASDPQYIDFVGVEAVVPPSQERMFCLYMHYDGPDAAFYDQQALQGKFGHHAILLSTNESKPDGTLEDCSDMSSLSGFVPFSLPFELPAGVGVFLPHGKPVVFQFHYVNAGKKPLRVRDVARLHKRELSEVTKFAAVWAANASNFEVPPHATSLSKQLDCTIDRDIDVLLLGGHMHEYGASIKAEMGTSANDLKPLYSVDTWKPEYRDLPPVELHQSDPVHIAKGTLIRTTCTWSNPSDQAIKFPREMCTTFGYATGIKDPFACVDGQIR